MGGQDTIRLLGKRRGNVLNIVAESKESLDTERIFR